MKNGKSSQCSFYRLRFLLWFLKQLVIGPTLGTNSWTLGLSLELFLPFLFFCMLHTALQLFICLLNVPSITYDAMQCLLKIFCRIKSAWRKNLFVCLLEESKGTKSRFAVIWTLIIGKDLRYNFLAEIVSWAKFKLGTC